MHMLSLFPPPCQGFQPYQPCTLSLSNAAQFSPQCSLVKISVDSWTTSPQISERSFSGTLNCKVAISLIWYEALPVDVMPWAINEYLTIYFHSDILLCLLLFSFPVSACGLEQIYVGSLILHTKYLWDLQLIRFLPVADKPGCLSTPSPQMQNSLFHPVFVRTLNATWCINIIINLTALFFL